MIPNAKSRCYDEGHKIPISQPSFSFLYLKFWHVICKALFAQGRIRAYFVFFQTFSAILFVQNVGRVFFVNGSKSIASKKIGMRTNTGLCFTLEKPHAIFQFELCKLGWENAGEFSLIL